MIRADISELKADLRPGQRLMGLDLGEKTIGLALSDTLLDDVVLLGPPSRIREGIDRFARAGVEWITMGPQSVASDSLARQAERMIAALAPR